ncbi:MAG: phosphotransferase, partial [bacterium]|nr:phosphotransferase [bacterium]
LVSLSEAGVPPTSHPLAALDALRELAKAHLDAKVAQETPLAGDASDRRYLRLHHPEASPAASVGMILTSPWEGGQLPFLQMGALLAKIGIPVPRVYGTNPAAGVILIEDAGDKMLEDVWNEGGWEAARAPYQEAVDLLLALQERAPRVEAAFVPETFARELHHTRRYAFEALLKMDAPENTFADPFDALAAEVCRLPFRLTHRDYHSRNLMVREGKLIVLDFQDARMGPITYDLASLVFDSYVSLPENAREELIGRYREGSDAARALGGSEAFAHALALTALQRNLKAIGTFAFQWAERGTSRYLSHIPPTAGHIRGHLEKLPRWRRFADQLAPYLDVLAQIHEENFR